MSQDNPAITRTRKIAQRAAPATLAVLLLSSCASTPRPQLTAADAADIDRITTYLNNIPRFEAHFVQYGSFGGDAGVVWVDRPAGHLRIDYSGPDAREMVISNGQVLILDRGTGATTTMPLSRTPLGMLLTPSINLSGPVTVASLVHQPDPMPETGMASPVGQPKGLPDMTQHRGGMQITLEKTDRPAQGSLTLTFAEQPLRLTAVTVTDAERRTLVMSLSNLNPAPALTPDMFQPPSTGS